MTGVEALQALLDGKKIRRQAWGEIYAVRYFLGRGSDIWEIEFVPNPENETLDAEEFLYDDWEVVE